MSCGKLFKKDSIKKGISDIIYLNNSMDTKFQSSFIPKQPVNEPSRSSSAGSNIFFLISFLILTVSLVGAGGSYLWDKQLDKNIASVNSNLNQARGKFDQNTIENLSRLNDKINTADTLLHNHVAPSILFDVIGRVTLKSVRFNSFKYTNAGGDKISISMTGEASSFESAAVQASAFINPELRGVFKNPIFTDPDLVANGQATFSFTTSIDPNLINYYKLKTDPTNQLYKSAGVTFTPRQSTDNIVQPDLTNTVDNNLNTSGL